MTLSPGQRRYLVADQAIGAGIFNLLLNALIAWLMFRRLSQVPMQGDPSVTGDIVATSFLLPFLTCLIVTPLVRTAARNGKVEPLAASPKQVPMLRWLPASLALRSFLIGLLSVVLIAPLVLIPFRLLGVQGLAFGVFVPFKAVYSAVLAAIVTPLIALYALATVTPKAAAA